MQLITALSALLAAVPLAEAGQALVQNNCPFTVYWWAADEKRDPSITPATPLAPGEKYVEKYHTFPNSGVSIKISRTPTLTHHAITQLEYNSRPDMLWYDGSNVNCRGTDCPFYAEGIYLEASVKSCPTRTCKQNADCTGFYINWNDDINTLSCDASADVNMYLCSDKAVFSVAEGTMSGGGKTPAAGSTKPSGVAAVPAVAASAAASAVGAVASGKIEVMEAPSSIWDSGKRKPSRFVKKIKAREAEIDARDLHQHMRRHNHRRSH